MQCEQTALVLEGGGFRGIYASGVLDYFMKKDLRFPYVIGVSMGAINGANYVSGQPGRSFAIARQFMPDRRYMGIGNLIKEGNFFSRRFAYNVLPRRYNLFDMKTYYNAPVRFYITATDVATGRAVYFEKMEGDVADLIAASSSLPFMSRMVEIKGKRYLDGGVADSIPVEKALADGNRKAVLVLTQPRGYRKKPYGHDKVVRARYGRYPAFAEAIINRHYHYNDTLDRIEQLEALGRIFVIRPERPIEADRIERNPEHVDNSYQMGYEQARKIWQDLEAFLKA